MSTRKCLNCQELGHITADYPNQKLITLVEWKVMEEQEIEEENEGDVKGNLKETLGR